MKRVIAMKEIITLKKAILLGITMLLFACGSQLNRPPMVDPIDDITISANTVDTSVIIHVSDDRTSIENLRFRFISSNNTLIDNISVSDVMDDSATLSITPVDDNLGESDVILWVTDAGGLSTRVDFLVNVIPQQVSANAFIRSTFALDNNENPVLVNAIELIQDVDDENEFDDLIDNSN